MHLFLVVHAPLIQQLKRHQNDRITLLKFKRFFKASAIVQYSKHVGVHVKVNKLNWVKCSVSRDRNFGTFT